MKNFEQVQQIMRKYMEQEGLSVRRFAAELPPDLDLSVSTIAQWSLGHTLPRFADMYYILAHGTGWQVPFALEILAILRPETWGTRIYA